MSAELLEQILSDSSVKSEQHDTSKINWVRGMSDPGEMIQCGYLPQLRRLANEDDATYQERIQLIINTLPPEVQKKIMDAGINAALKRASLNVTNGRVSAVFARTPAWHNLGVVMDKCFTAAQAREQGQMNFIVDKVPHYYQWGPYSGDNSSQNPWIQDEDSFCLVRRDTGRKLTKKSVGSRYQPVQNAEGTDVLDSVVGDFGAHYESAGVLYGGEKVWLLVNFPKHGFKVNGNDEHKAYIAYFMPHDGSGVGLVFATDVRLECLNTTRNAIAQDGAKAYRIRHTGDIRTKIADAQAACGLAVEGFEQAHEEAEHMVATPQEFIPYAKDVLDTILEISEVERNSDASVLARSMAITEANQELYRKTLEKKQERHKELLDEALNIYETRNNGVNGMRGTAYSNYTTFAEMADYSDKFRKYRGDEMTKASKRFESIISGEADNIKQVAYQKALV